MKQVNFRIDSGDEASLNNKLVMEGGIEGLKLLNDRISKALESEINSTACVTFELETQNITYDGGKVAFEIRKVDTIDTITRKSRWKQKDVLIALGIVFICALIVIIALVQSGGKIHG